MGARNDREGERPYKGRIIFSSVASGNWELWSVDPDGTDIRQITDTPQDEHSPAVSPDGKEILYVDNQRKLWIMNFDGSHRREVPLPRGIYAQPAWAPDGKAIAFVKYIVIPSDASEIWVMERKDGEWGEAQRITAYPPMRLHPSYSPDGAKIAYAQFKRDKLLGAVEDIGILSLNDMKFVKLTADNVDSFKPVWSPTGDRIAYTSNKSGNYDIWVVSLKDNRHTQLTTDPSYDGDPTWSPDGSEIAFISTRSGSKEIWSISATGDNLRQVTATGKTSKDPFWIK
jgi:TolB protein